MGQYRITLTDAEDAALTAAGGEDRLLEWIRRRLAGSAGPAGGHTITLSDADEDALAWASRKAGRADREALLLEWIHRGLAEAAADLNKGLAAFGELDQPTRDRIVRAVLGRPDPEPDRP